MLYLIGLGLGNERDITLAGLDAVKQCATSSGQVWLEHYTAILPDVSIQRLEQFYECKVQLADRHTVEQNSHLILDAAREQDVAFLVVGDPFAATTHHDLLLRASELEIPVHSIHNASIMNAVGITGLQLYSFGQTISLPFFHSQAAPSVDEHSIENDNAVRQQATSWYERIAQNHALNLHTLCLLDIKVKEQSLINMARGVAVFEPPRYMTCNQGIAQMLRIDELQTQEDEATTTHVKCCGPETRAFGVARLGHKEQRIVSGTLSELLNVDFGLPLHSVALCAPQLHTIEEEMFEYWHWNKANRVEANIQRKVSQAAEKEAELEQRLADKRRGDEQRRRQAKVENLHKLVLAEQKAAKLVQQQQSASTAPTSAASDDEESMSVEPLF